jgi:protein phosphatase
MVVSYTSFKGSVHDTNQDYVKVDEERKILLVSDGIGSFRNSHMASKAAVEISLLSLRMNDFRSRDPHFVYNAFRTAVKMANSQVYHMIEQSRAESNDCIDNLIGGCTLDIGVVVEDIFYFAHVGDGRIYKVEGDVLRVFTRKDCINEKEGITVLDKWIGCSEAELKSMTIQVGRTPLNRGDQILMCTDGMYYNLPHEFIYNVLKKEAFHPFVKLRYLYNGAVFKGCTDDCSGILYTHE